MRQVRMRSAASLFRHRGPTTTPFQIPTGRKEHKATALATNSPLSEWNSVLNEPRLRAAIASRITLRRTLIPTGTGSYRFQATEDERGTRKTP
ncbi:ATP-binding protein [Streptomyces odonnellii]|uniref:ATP-binding protein n=1 Tax=Streptomyces odonnellii TaxID=1417980 RepID=UPI00062608E7|nr:ATP-binding protein [Streptomyces odonnellii]